MQAQAVDALRDRKLNQKDLAERIGRSVSAVGQALRTKPAANSETLRDIFNYLFPQSAQAALTGHARQLARQVPEVAALLSAIFRDLADLLGETPSGNQSGQDTQPGDIAASGSGSVAGAPKPGRTMARATDGPDS